MQQIITTYYYVISKHILNLTFLNEPEIVFCWVFIFLHS